MRIISKALCASTLAASLAGIHFQPGGRANCPEIQFLSGRRGQKPVRLPAIRRRPVARAHLHGRRRCRHPGDGRRRHAAT